MFTFFLISRSRRFTNIILKMFLKIKRLSPLLLASTGAAAAVTTQVTKENNTNDKPALDQLRFDSSTGWERVKMIFKRNEFGEGSPDYSLIGGSILIGATFGGLKGGFEANKKALHNFLEHNDATKFQNVTEARKQLGIILSKEMIKGVFAGFPPYAFLIGSFTCLSTLTSTYRGKLGILDYLFAGAVTGSLYRINYGLRGMVAGSVLGLVYGACIGITIVPLQWITGDDIEKSRKDFHNLYYYSQRQMRKRQKQYAEETEMSEMEREKLKNLKGPVSIEDFDNTQKQTA